MRTLPQPLTVAVHPWEVLKEYIKGIGLTQRDFATLVGKTQPEVNCILNGTKDINADWAIRCSIIFQTRPEFWLSMQFDYNSKVLMISKKEEYEAILDRCKVVNLPDYEDQDLLDE